MTRVMLDTNAYRGLLGGDHRVAEAIGDADEVLVPVVVVGELLEAFKLGSKEKINKARMNGFLREPSVRVVGLERETAEMYAKIRVQLHRKGKPIPVNDVWIAAQAMEMNATLVTFDKHFEEIDGLKVWR